MSKYNSKKVEVDGILFDSSIEAEYYKVLKNKGEKFDIHPKFILQEKCSIDGEKIGGITYVADFRVGNTVIDIKGVETTDFKMKAKMFKAKYKNLKLICLAKCPLKYIKYSNNGFINKDVLNKLQRENRIKIDPEAKKKKKMITEDIKTLKKFIELNKKYNFITQTSGIKDRIKRLENEKNNVGIVVN